MSVRLTPSPGKLHLQQIDETSGSSKKNSSRTLKFPMREPASGTESTLHVNSPENSWNFSSLLQAACSCISSSLSCLWSTILYVCGFFDEKVDTAALKELLEDSRVHLRIEDHGDRLVWPPFGFFEAATGSFDRQMTNRRAWLETKLVENAVTQFPPEQTDVFRLLCLHPDGFLQELLVIVKLLERGYKSIDVTFYGIQKRTELYQKFKALARQFAKEKGAALTLNFDLQPISVKRHAALMVGFENFSNYATFLIDIFRGLEDKGGLYVGIDSATYVLNKSGFFSSLPSPAVTHLKTDMCKVDAWTLKSQELDYFVLNPLTFFEMDFWLLKSISEMYDKRVNVRIIGTEHQQAIQSWLSLLAQRDKSFAICFYASLEQCREKADFISAFFCLTDPDKNDPIVRMLKPEGSLYIADDKIGLKRVSAKRGDQFLVNFKKAQ